MNYNLLRAKEVFFIMVLSMGLFNHVILIPMLLESAARDAWISVLASFFPFLLFIWMVYYITNVNTTQKDVEYLFPLFLNGYAPFLKGVFYSLTGLTEIFVIILIQHHLTGLVVKAAQFTKKSPPAKKGFIYIQSLW